MILTTKARYAVMAIIEISENKENKPISLTSISKHQKISLSYLEQIFISLKKAGIVKSVKGPGGGYFLAKDSKTITLADVISAMGESIKMTRCESKNNSCLNKKNAKCKTHHIWHGLEKRIHEYFNSISLNQL